ncbi:MAG: sugar phosphate nucleotidyltransferase [Patescibacteria group bacterium]|jgi:NDP-sugar pyrophosphorylase family protein
MIWILPLAGKGTRTKEMGEFKPFIKINGQPILGWCLSSVKHLFKPTDKIILITTHYFAEKYHFQKETEKLLQKHRIPNPATIITCDEAPGASATILKAKKKINNAEPVIVVNPDQYIDFALPQNFKKNTAYLGVYFNMEKKSGFVRIKNGIITSFVEKKAISYYASAGVYLSPTGKKLVAALEHQIAHGKKLNGEYYIGPAFNYLINNGMTAIPLPVYAKYDLGNPESIKYFRDKRFRY